MNGAQFELDFTTRAAAGEPVVTASEVEWFIDKLRGREWQTARDLGATNEAMRRKLRAVAEAAVPKIISGQRGYKLTAEATPADIESFAWLRRQSRTNLRRYILTVRYWHQLPHTQR